MQSILGRYQSEIYALMRIVVGLLFVCHGVQKLFGLLGGVQGSGNSAPLFSMYGAAGLIEVLAGLMVALGIFGTYAAFVASGEMAVAYFMVHFPRGFWPIQNGGELAVLYCWVFIYIAARGTGTWSITKQ